MAELRLCRYWGGDCNPVGVLDLAGLSWIAGFDDAALCLDIAFGGGERRPFEGVDRGEP
eukprot:CAMPEP_0114496592 /NCGR_PEP_ID=MMETSP0109-20121206/5855_1 /TAXON_ID=29199 /ORGANISM="Chlorarachnion reptans, Strain CCCM449" /LENGTH=58 /DNA_ID=CAMNT_0001673881 /DNA_START=672 /DNA_END=848 /DNA_ORIENTATION=+